MPTPPPISEPMGREGHHTVSATLSPRRKKVAPPCRPLHRTPSSGACATLCSPDMLLLLCGLHVPDFNSLVFPNKPVLLVKYLTFMLKVNYLVIHLLIFSFIEFVTFKILVKVL